MPNPQPLLARNTCRSSHRKLPCPYPQGERQGPRWSTLDLANTSYCNGLVCLHVRSGTALGCRCMRSDAVACVFWPVQNGSPRMQMQWDAAHVTACSVATTRASREPTVQPGGHTSSGYRRGVGTPATHALLWTPGSSAAALWPSAQATTDFAHAYPINTLSIVEVALSVNNLACGRQRSARHARASIAAGQKATGCAAAA